MSVERESAAPPKPRRKDKKSNHTPGPWHYIGDNDGDFVVWAGSKFLANVGGAPFAAVSLDPQNELVAFDVEQANARLIAAAPEMLEVLDELISKLRIACDPKRTDVQLVEREQFWQIIDKAKAAILKAGGR